MFEDRKAAITPISEMLNCPECGLFLQSSPRCSETEGCKYRG